MESYNKIHCTLELVPSNVLAECLQHASTCSVAIYFNAQENDGPPIEHIVVNIH